MHAASTTTIAVLSHNAAMIPTIVNIVAVLIGMILSEGHTYNISLG